jgi:XTP/dITP diphosphohydrolase
MTKKLLLATNNPSKAKEISNSLKKTNLKITSLLDIDKSKYSPEPPENGATFEDNARIKAEFWNQQTDIITLADDSGILVDALPNELGVQTARFGKGAEADDEEWLDYFLERMEEAKTRRAKFVCVLALASAKFSTRFFYGEVQGKILNKIAAPILPRIPLSSVFLADGAEQVFAAMTDEEKARFSHRGKALEQFSISNF